MPQSVANFNPEPPLFDAPADHVTLLHPANRSGGAAIAVRADRWVERLVPIADLPGEVRCLRGVPDAYISQQSFNGWRRISQLRTLGATYIDLDYHGTSYASASADYVAALVLRTIDNAALPSPSYILATGRGLLVTWLHEPIPRAALPRWQAVQRHLATALTEFGADRKALDAARVFRIVGTVNSKTNQPVRLVWPIRPSFERWDFDDLAREVLPIDRAELTSIAAARARRNAQDGQIRPTRHLTAGTWWEAVLTDLQRLRQHRWFGELPPGHRDAWLFLACNAMSYLVPLIGLRRECYALAAEAGSTWTDSETDSRMSSVYARAAAAARGQTVEWLGQAVDPRYRFRASTIIDWLDVTPQEMRDAGLRAIVDRDRRRELATEREKDRRRRAGAVERQAFEQNSLSKSKPWEALGMSRATWYRKGKPQPGTT